MTDTVFYVASAVLVLGILAGISLMSRVQTAVLGNRISAVSALLAILLTMWHSGIIDLMGLWICLLIGLLIGLLLAWRVKMIHMPQTVALLNGFGGASSALIAIIAWQQSGQPNAFLTITAALALAVGAVTFTGSMIAAAKLQQLMTQKPVVLPGHAVITGVLLLLTA
ncbi:MAG: NAD(P)(+) transhydrogenase (Re/Si-specific) subunit beta, partial [Eubacteriales bacterium]|nr:NAD(P)(+) transhydrogenase (Re/Si-specific) subunit beta [Eubacteriales bacterium]